jgi:farnesyl diphosphate synthase
LLDVEGDAAVIGKATGKDARKATLVSAIGAAAARQRLAALEREAISALSPFGGEADVLREAAHFIVRRRA